MNYRWNSRLAIIEKNSEGNSPGVRDALQDLHGFTTERATRSIERLSKYRGVPGEDQVAR